MKIGILEPEAFSDTALEELKVKGTIELFQNNDLKNFLEDKNILFIRLGFKIDKDFLNNSPKLQYLCSPTTGLNHIEIDETKKRGIEIISLKGEASFLQTIRATPEHIFGVTISLLRNFKKAINEDTLTNWDRDSCKGNEIYGKKVGIIGIGRIGKILVNYFNAFGATVYGFDTQRYNLDGVMSCSSISEVIETSEIVIICINYSSENHEVFDKKYIDLMKGKWVINCARGELFNESYLLEKINENWFKGIAVDVISNENKQNNNHKKWMEFSKKENLILTPHIGGCTIESMQKTEEFIAKKLINQL